mgnify:CR=1 FL=1
MYLKKIEGPRSVTLPDGTVMTRADLPPSNTIRWVASRKALVIQGIWSGLITRNQAIEAYQLSELELDEWENAVRNHGVHALKATTKEKYRQL